jgi:polyisoprenoid-binding protein YceI
MSVIEQPVTIPAGSWAADPTHSSVEFEIKHLGLATIRGRAGAIAASLDTTGPEPVISGTIEAARLTTFDQTRDEHLSSPDFFDAGRYPEIAFRSTGFSLDDSHGRVQGELTIKGVTRPVDLDAQVTGVAEDPWGNTRIGIDLDTVIDRTDFGVAWNAPLPGGGFLLSDDVRLLASFSFVKEA